MLLSFLSSVAFSLARKSVGLPRFFSSGTSAARGWRWPTGAGNTPPPPPAPEFFTAVDEPPPLWANPAGAPIRSTSAIDRRVLRIPASPTSSPYFNASARIDCRTVSPSLGGAILRLSHVGHGTEQPDPRGHQH